MTARHSVPVRGLESTKTSPLFQGRFGRMFRTLPAATFGATDSDSRTNLLALGTAMAAGFDAPHDGLDDEESGIPALYTYLGQFIDHDITFDPASSLQQQNDPDALTDFRTPALDLDNVYGRGPQDQPYMYANDGMSFLLGAEIHGGAAPAFDLPRNAADPARALIGDPRNDENSIVSQLQGLFLRFHNRTVRDNPGMAFADVQRTVRFHYQYVVLNDFLPRIVHSSVMDALRRAGRLDPHLLEFFHWKHQPFMPVEFSVAAYRMGHSMVRPGYRLNDTILLPIFPVPAQGFNEGLTGFRAMIPDWGIDFGRFVDVDRRNNDGTADDQKRRLQFAYRIDTSIVDPLAALPPEVAADPSSLPQRNLLRGLEMGLPSGQSVARAMGLTPMADSDILIGKGVDKPDAPLPDITSVSPAFAGSCPLWTYILAEAMRHQETVTIPVNGSVTVTTPRLGPVGGRIVAEVLLGLLAGDASSLLTLDPHWQPPSGPAYALKDFVQYALGA